MRRKFLCSMDALGFIEGTSALFTRVFSLDVSKRMLMGKFEYLRARIDDREDVVRAHYSGWVQLGKKRKRDYDLYVWVTEGRKLLMVADSLLTQLEECDGLIMRIKMMRVVNEFVETLESHDKKGDMLFLHAFSDGGGPHCGRQIPVKDLVGRASILTELEHLLLDAEIGGNGIAIHGGEGIGKTFLMKHLHNRVLKWGEMSVYVFWVSFPDEFSIKHVQDALGAVAKCDFSSDDDVNVRAAELSKKLGDLGRIVLFLDGVPQADFTLDQIGIPVPAEGSACKLVCTTSSTSLGCRMLDGFKTVELECLSEEDAFQLFMREAKIDMSSVTLLNDVPRLLTRMCHGVPRMIVDTASNMLGITDLHEWEHELFEMGNL